MHKSTFAALALAFVAPAQQQPELRTQFELNGARVVLEYHWTHGEVAMIVEAESDQQLEHLEVRAPDGRLLLDLNAGGGQPLVLSGLRIESVVTVPSELLSAWPEGEYTLFGRARDGRLGRGHTQLSHRLLRPPVVTYPSNGSTGVPTNNLVVTWNLNPATSAYEIVLEQDDADDLKATVRAGSNSFQVPSGMLLPGTETVLEVVAISPEGNRTASEVTFTTQ